MKKEYKDKLNKDIQYGKDMQSYWNQYRKDFLILLVVVIVILVLYFLFIK